MLLEPEGLFGQIMVGAGTSAVNLVIHATLLAAIARVITGLRMHDGFVPGLLQRTLVIFTTGALLVAAHFLEVLVWAVTYYIVDAAPPGTPLIYFAFVNYTTLGYGDIVPVPEWRLLAPITALNGIMLIGWSTALVYAVLRSTALADRFMRASRKREAA
jgi:Ion channel